MKNFWDRKFFLLCPVSLTPMNSLSLELTTPAINTKLRIPPQIFIIQWDWGDGGKLINEKNWRRKSHVRLPLNRRILFKQQWHSTFSVCLFSALSSHTFIALFNLFYSLIFSVMHILLYLFSVGEVLLKMATRMKMKTMMIFMILLSLIQTGTARSWSWLPGSQDNETADIQVWFIVKISWNQDMIYC